MSVRSGILTLFAFSAFAQTRATDVKITIAVDEEASPVDTRSATLR